MASKVVRLVALMIVVSTFLNLDHPSKSYGRFNVALVSRLKVTFLFRRGSNPKKKKSQIFLIVAVCV